jgi:Ca2+-binding RTX toxin-like protein
MADDARDDVFDLEVPVSNSPEDLDDVEQQETRADDFDGDDRLTLGTAHRADEHGPEVLPEGGRADDASLLTVAAEGDLTQLDNVSRSTTAQEAVLPGDEMPDGDTGHGIDRDIGGRPGTSFGQSENNASRAVFDAEGDGPDSVVSEDTIGATTAEPDAVAAEVAETAASTQDEVGSANSRKEDVSADETADAEVALAVDADTSDSSNGSDGNGSGDEETADDDSTDIQGESGQTQDATEASGNDGNGNINGNGNARGLNDGDNGHGNDVGGYDDSNPGNSQGTSTTGNSGQSGGNGQNKDKDDNGHGNDEGGYDDSNPGKSEGTAPQSQPAQSGNEDEDNEAGQTLDGTKGDDTLAGGSGDDVIDGGKGADTISGGLGDDDMSGGLGNDRFTISNNDFDGNAWTDQISGDQGTDTIDISAVDQGWTLTVDGSDDPIVSGETALSEYTEGGAFSGVVDFDDGSSVVFDGVERVEW